jgi:hypothetical protein
VVAHYDHGKLRIAGGVGRGYTARMRRDLLAKLRPLSRDAPAIADIPRAEARDGHWVEPVLVTEVEFTEWSRDGRLRHPSFQGLREDKHAREVRAERPKRHAWPPDLSRRGCVPWPAQPHIVGLAIWRGPRKLSPKEHRQWLIDNPEPCCRRRQNLGRPFL